jgi:hypothetical protein
LVVEGQRLNPPPPRIGKRGRPKLGPAAALLARLDRHRDDVLRLTSDFRVPFDNNQAERDVRMVKLQQKISGGRRSAVGVRCPGVQAAAPGGAQRSREGSWSGFRRRIQGDLVAECLEVADVVADGPLRAAADVVVVGAEVDEVGLGVG